ncbi:MAG: PilZ domain-containing protein [Lachnospiraceae bacterium]|nr:PilZ domain-containing protein [Lachnospiraceae bacterium]
MNWKELFWRRRTVETERRKSKRLPLEVSIELEKIEIDDIITVKYLTVDVIDLSRSGIGFKTNQELKVGSFFDTRLQIWTREVLDAIIEIVRVSKDGDTYTYGCTFVGMTETDTLKIDIYQMFNE